MMTIQPSLRRAIAFTAPFLFAALFHAAAAKPNIVIIYTDDQGYGDVSALNPDSKFQTPHIDRLVREGMTFTDGHCSDTVCTPSRYGLLTGRYSWRSRLKKGVMGAEGECLIENGRVTLASLLRDNGYNTAMVGKWHLGMQFDGKVGQRDWSKPFTDGPIEKGFDHFFGIPASMNYGVLTYLQQDRVLKPANLWTAKKPGLVQGDRASYRIMPPYEKKRPTNADARRKPLEVADDFVDSEVLRIFLDKATEWIDGVAADARKGKPFFLYLPLTSPHKPVCPQKEFIGKSEAGHYGDFMIETDHRVGQLLAALDKHHLADDTMVILHRRQWRRKTPIAIASNALIIPPTRPFAAASAISTKEDTACPSLSDGRRRSAQAARSRTPFARPICWRPSPISSTRNSPQTPAKTASA